MHYQDLTPYEYFKFSPIKNGLNVGWLDAKQPYPQGEVPVEFLSKLRLFYRNRVHQTRGFHICPFCDPSRYQFPTVLVDGKETGLGTSEIVVPGKAGECYVAPDLVYHYIAAHSYLPPSPFIHAVMEWEPDDELM